MYTEAEYNEFVSEYEKQNAVLDKFVVEVYKPARIAHMAGEMSCEDYLVIHKEHDRLLRIAGDYGAVVPDEDDVVFDVEDNGQLELI